MKAKTILAESAEYAGIREGKTREKRTLVSS
jgi:hypothetical protein